MVLFTAILFLITVIAPIAFWFWFFIWQDRSEPEPKKLLIKTFFLGVGITIFAIGVEALFFSVFFSHQYKDFLSTDIASGVAKFSFSTALIVFLAGFIEEILKYFAVWEFVYRKVEFNQVADGVFYAITLALGFSFTENILYFYKLSSGSTNFFVISTLVRGIATVLLHITATGIIGYALGKMKFTAGHKKSIVVVGLALAMLLHGLFNILNILIAFPLVLLVFLYLLYILQKPEARTVWRLVYPKRDDTMAISGARS